MSDQPHIGEPVVLVEFQNLPQQSHAFRKTAGCQGVHSRSRSAEEVERVFLKRELVLLFRFPHASQGRKVEMAVEVPYKRLNMLAAHGQMEMPASLGPVVIEYARQSQDCVSIRQRRIDLQRLPCLSFHEGGCFPRRNPVLADQREEAPTHIAVGERKGGIELNCPFQAFPGADRRLGSPLLKIMAGFKELLIRGQLWRIPSRR